MDTQSNTPAQPGTQDADPTDGRDETPSERYDRNWGEILQEFRVTQTGTQIISGFLLTLAFQQRVVQIRLGRVGHLVVSGSTLDPSVSKPKES